MDVAAVFLRLVDNPVLRERFNAAADIELSAAEVERLAVLVFLHDIGKLHPGFQAKGWPPGLWRKSTCGHLKEGWSFLLLAARQREHPFHQAMQAFRSWGTDATIANVIAAAFTHHGRPVPQPPRPSMRDWGSPLPHYDWRAEATRIGEALQHWFPTAFEEPSLRLLPSAPRFHHLLAGAISLADWIGSDTRFFRYHAPFAPDYSRIARSRAGEAVATIGLNPPRGGPSPTFGKLTAGLSPNPAQVAVGDLPLSAQLVILEAETGSGKTEAALWRFVLLFAAGKVSSLYFAVPTRAAARQLHRRVCQALQRVLGESLPAVLAIPSVLRVGEFEGERLPHWRVRWDDTDSAPCRWAAEHATRFLAAPIAVGTVDQAMLAGLQVKHAHLRGTALSRSLLVVDEVHASDKYMTEVLARLTKDHLANGGYAMLMSATLGSSARERWLHQVSRIEVEHAQDTPYPAVWCGGSSSPVATPRHAGRVREVSIETAPTMAAEPSALKAVIAARRGARVLVIRNTVATAIETWVAVKEAGEQPLLMQVQGGPALHHGRFAVEDRALLDQAVENTLAGDEARRLGKGCIVIGTQTLEQSLDIDADILITDLCPMDVLLQRLGRVHRHNLPRPVGFEMPQAVVLMPEPGLDDLTKPAFHNGLGAWERDGALTGVYRDLAVLELTRRSIGAETVWRLPAMNRMLVERATHPELVAQLVEEKGDAWKRYQTRFDGTELAGKMLATINVLDRTEPLLSDQPFATSDEKIMTRLGEDGVVLEIEPTAGPFGLPIKSITLPAQWSQGATEVGSVVPVIEEPDSLLFAVGERTFRYSRKGLELPTSESHNNGVAGRAS